MKRLTRLFLTGAVAMICAGSAWAAEEGTVKMFAPWQSGGQVFRIGPDKLLFQGRAEGIMYVEDGKGALGGDIMVRTVLGEMASDLGSGETIGGAAGLAIWPSLSYKIPGN